MADIVLVGRRSSHFTRVVRIVAAELGVELSLQPVLDLMSLDPADYGGHPALKLPVLLREQGPLFGCLNICRLLAAESGQGDDIVFPERGLDPVHLNACEIVLDAMGVHTEIVFHELVARRPPDAASLKRRKGLVGSLGWLDAHVDAVLERLPSRRTSFFEAALYSLLTHIAFRHPMDLSAWTRLEAFRRGFDLRASAQATGYAFDAHPAAQAGQASGDGWEDRILDMGAGLEAVVRECRDGRDLGSRPGFDALVAALAEHADAGRRLRCVTDASSTALACAALAAMARAGDDSHAAVARVLDRVDYFGLPYALDLLGGSEDPGVFALALLRLSTWASDYPALRSQIFRYMEGRLVAGVLPQLADADMALDWNFEDRRNALADFDQTMTRDFLAALDRLDRQRQAVDRERPPAWCPTVRDGCDRIHASLVSHARASLLLVGEPGSGRMTTLRAVLRALARDGWTVIEASPRDLLAGLQHVHPVEERIESLVAGVAGDRHLWHVLRWHELLDDPDDGSPTLLERLWPYLQQGRLQLAGVAMEYTLARAEQDMPRFESVVTPMAFAQPGRAELRELAGDWALRQQQRVGTAVIDEDLLERWLDWAATCCPRRAEPGRSLAPLQDAVEAMMREAQPRWPLARADLLLALSRRSGLPLPQLEGLQ